MARHRRADSDDTRVHGTVTPGSAAYSASSSPARTSVALLVPDAPRPGDHATSVVDTIDLTEALRPIRVTRSAPWERTWCWSPPTPADYTSIPSPQGPRRLRPPVGVRTTVVSIACGAALAVGVTVMSDEPDDMGENYAGSAVVAAPASPARRDAFPVPRPTPRSVPTTPRPRVPRHPRSAVPVVGVVTSGYGMRWGSEHYGLDIANDIGTPIYSVTDGVVLDSGPAAGFGLWVRIRQDDGTIAVYGHINETLVATGQRVLAGEEIATVGNRGNSTGPHLHFEVLQSDSTRLDPVAWLQARGVAIG